MPEITLEGLSQARASMRPGRRQIKWNTQANPKDDFGRSYTTFLDRSNLHQTGQVIRNFSEPIPVPDKYVRYDVEQPWRMAIDFKLWHRDEIAANQRWTAREEQSRVHLYGAEAVDREPTAASLKLAGPKPLPSAIVALYANGDPFLLGAQADPTPAVAKVFEGDHAGYVRWVLGYRERPLPSDVVADELGLATLDLPEELRALHEAGGAGVAPTPHAGRPKASGAASVAPGPEEKVSRVRIQRPRTIDPSTPTGGDAGDAGGDDDVIEPEG